MVRNDPSSTAVISTVDRAKRSVALVLRRHTVRKESSHLILREVDEDAGWLSPAAAHRCRKPNIQCLWLPSVNGLSAESSPSRTEQMH